MTTRRTPTRRVLAGSPFNKPDAPAAPVEVYEVDDRVSHDRHGLGRVISVEADSSVVVDFSSTTQRVAADSPKMSKLSSGSDSDVEDAKDAKDTDAADEVAETDEGTAPSA